MENSLSRKDITRIALRYVLPGVLLLLIGWFLLTYNFYTFSITSKGDLIAPTVTSVSGLEHTNTTHIFDIFLVPRSTDYVEVSAGDKKTRLTLQEKPLLGIKKEVIHLDAQNTITKVGKDGLGCNGSTSVRVFSYKCYIDMPNILLFANRDNNETENKLLQNITINPSVSTLYKDGFLTLQKDEEGGGRVVVIYTNIIDGSTSMVTLSVPTDGAYRLEADVAGSDSFGVVDAKNNVVYLYNKLDAQPIQLKRKVVSTSNKDGVDCTLRNKQMACYYGVVTEPDVGSDTAREQQDLRTKNSGSLGGIEVYDFSSRSVVSYSSGQWPLQKICTSPNGRLYALSGRNIFVAPRNTTPGDAIRFSVVANDATQLICGERIIYSSEKSLFSLSDISSQLVFYEPRMRLSTIQASNKKILFNIFLDGVDGDRVSHTYFLDETRLTNDDRPEKILPYTTNSSNLFLEFDYTKKVIYIKPVVSVVSDREANKTIIDQGSLAQTKQKIEDKLQRDGLLSKYRIVYSF